MNQDPKSMMEELERLKAENEKLKSGRKGPGEITFKVSAKGALSVYGLGRFPTTLYKEQWERLLQKIDGLKSFIKENESRLRTR
ncbi:MAG: hypothetical protein V1647_01590 [Pseudomonadota bacterium]